MWFLVCTDCFFCVCVCDPFGYQCSRVSVPVVFRLMYASVLGSLLHLGLGLQLHWADTARDRLVVGEMSWAYFALGLCRFACPGIVN